MEALRTKEQARVLTVLTAATFTFQHMRIGQIIENAVPDWYRDQGRPVPNDLFYISDTDLADALFAYIRKYERETA